MHKKSLCKVRCFYSVSAQILLVVCIILKVIDGYCRYLSRVWTRLLLHSKAFIQETMFAVVLGGAIGIYNLHKEVRSKATCAQGGFLCNRTFLLTSCTSFVISIIFVRRTCVWTMKSLQRVISIQHYHPSFCVSKGMDSWTPEYSPSSERVGRCSCGTWAFATALLMPVPLSAISRYITFI